MRDMQAFADELGVQFKFDSMMNPRIDCSQSPLAVRLSPEECVALDLEDPRRVDEWKVIAKEYQGPAESAPNARTRSTTAAAASRRLRSIRKGG